MRANRLFFEFQVVYVFADKESCHIRGFVPGGFAGHRVEDEGTVDTEVVEGDVADGVGVVITGDDGEGSVGAGIADIIELDVLDPLAGGCIVFFVIHYPKIDELPLPEVFDADVVEMDVSDQVAVTGVEAHTALVVYLVFLLVEDVYVFEAECLEGIGMSGVAVGAHEDRMGDVGPEGGMPDGNVPGVTIIIPAMAIDGDAVVRIAHEDVVDQDVAGTEDVDAVVISSGAKGFEVADPDVLAGADEDIFGSHWSARL